MTKHINGILYFFPFKRVNNSATTTMKKREKHCGFRPPSIPIIFEMQKKIARRHKHIKSLSQSDCFIAK